MVGGGLDYSAPFQRAIELIGKRWTGAVVKALIPRLLASTNCSRASLESAIAS